MECLILSTKFAMRIPFHRAPSTMSSIAKRLRLRCAPHPSVPSYTVVSRKHVGVRGILGLPITTMTAAASALNSVVR